MVAPFPTRNQPWKGFFLPKDGSLESGFWRENMAKEAKITSIGSTGCRNEISG
jgi:hypothetical protein